MAIRVREIAGSEEGAETLDTASASITYRVFDPDNPDPSIADMRAAVIAKMPASYGFLALDRLSREYDEEGNSWQWTAEYNFKPPESSLRWGFDTQGGSVRVTHSLATSRYPAGAPNFNGAIGYKRSADGSGDIEGVDKVIPALKISATYRWPVGAFTSLDINTLAALSGTVNQSAWQGYAAGELLFLGASGEIVPGLPTEVTYEFAASANTSGLTIGSIGSIAKAGHDYLWVLWEDDEDASQLTKNPLAVYVERVYTQAAFSALGIG